jgi:hypothetical protein
MTSGVGSRHSRWGCRDTVDRWIRRHRAGGFDALVPSIRQRGTRIDTGVLEVAGSQLRSGEWGRRIRAMAVNAPAKAMTAATRRLTWKPSTNAVGRGSPDASDELSTCATIAPMTAIPIEQTVRPGR